MIRHCVWIRFRPEVTPQARRALLGEIRGLVGSLPGLMSVELGRNAGYEDMDHGFSDGFIATFLDADALARYQADPRHRATGARLVEAAQGGLQGLLVFDLDIPATAA